MDTNKKQQSMDWNRHEARKIPQNEPIPQDDKISKGQNQDMKDAPQDHPLAGETSITPTDTNPGEA